jgi:deoxyribodipyrimidine photolyase-related protein
MKFQQEVTIVLPNQLFREHPCIEKNTTVILVEEYLFFDQYKFHKQKIKYHRATMKFYESYLNQQGISIYYIDSKTKHSDIRNLIPYLSQKGVKQIKICEPVDDWLERRLEKQCQLHQMELVMKDSPLFINTRKELQNYFLNKKRFFQTEFYIDQRKKRNILMDETEKPIGGKWTFDDENRKKYPKGKKPPKVEPIPENNFDLEAIDYINEKYKDNYGRLNYKYPTTFKEADKWLEDFFKYRFQEFGAYEDAIVDNENILHHSVLTPMMNTGLLLPFTIIQKAIGYAEKNNISVNSLEGFVRQILGWREFIRAVYVLKGRQERTTNFWNFTNEIPKSFYSAKTGIYPIDSTITKTLNTAYNHHIERLMILGNFMLLIEIHPDSVYQWFMEMYIDAYDWVMVPNVYGMSQFADGGLMATKPYISGSNYILKMSNMPKGNWQDTWDALFWHFMNKQRAFFLKNPRLSMLIKSFDKQTEEKKATVRKNALAYLNLVTKK